MVRARAVTSGPETVPVAVALGDGRMADVFGALASERIVFLGQRIDENVALDACARLLALEAEDPEGEDSDLGELRGGDAVLRDGHLGYDGVRVVPDQHRRARVRRGAAGDARRRGG